MSEANNTPSTNRGVTCAKEEYLHVLIDWCQLTIKEYDVRTICHELLNIPFDLFRDDNRKGIKGYHASYCYDDIRILESSGVNAENGIQLLMSGQGCRNYEMFLEANGETWFDFFERCLIYCSNVPRLDLAIDDYKTYFKIATLKKMAKNGNTVGRLRVGREDGSFALKDGETKGETLNIGSRSGKIFMVFYEKNYEQAAKLGLDTEEPLPKWNRYEIRFRQEKAVAAMKELITSRKIDEVAFSILNESIRFVVPFEDKEDKDKRRWPLWTPWAWFMKDTKKLKLSIEPKRKTLEKLLVWLAKAVAPSLWVIREIDRICGTDQLKSLIDNAAITDKHKQMVIDYTEDMQRKAFYRRREKREKENKLESYE
ncbi:replication initiation factor domain-containing protein [Candidatus Enterococcus clewellii]|uniref:Phage replication initiation protein n=1 Tax=Candidatus Enterococcus clewellii TaxID=1834193 RepID=A0A242K8F1_9ENTE|nr:replication initiation factor domain-containing protein [Enterococcus sp. 9E7_DIV0242]OTP17443.1 hypothetical protein A5888_001581 [Enterococcus sp. 9E7_DIV0242]